MVNYPRKILLGGFCVVAVGFASYVLEPGNGVLPWYKPAGAEQSGSSVFGISENRPNMTPRVDLNSIDPTSNLSVAQVLQAVHDSLQRNDLASAKLLLDALKNKHSDDKQAPPIQENLQVRRGSADSIFPTASNDKPRKADGTFRRFQRATPRLSIKSGPSEVLTMTQSRPRMVPRFFQPTVVNGKPQPSDNVVQDATTTISPTPKMLPQEPRAETAPLTLVTPPAPAQKMAPATDIIEKKPTQPIATLGQKTRGDVQAELARARSDGSLPRFGNPDPAGPGVKTISSSP